MPTILVVDDEEANRRLVDSVLEPAGYQVLTAGSGAEGIEKALAHAPDLVLMDVQMPGMDGVTALKSLRADPRTAALKVIAVTGQALKGDAERLLGEGFDGYVAKPIRYKELMTAVAKLIGPGAST